MLIADCGTVWTKIFDSKTKAVKLVQTQQLHQQAEARFDWATGHLGESRAGHYENELVCLAAGSLALVPEDDFIVVDIGGRDSKFCSFKKRELSAMNWNRSCGGTTGFILDLLAKFYSIDYADMPAAREAYDVACGIFGIEKVFDDHILGAPPRESVAKLILSVAKNVYNFLEQPKKIYVSGGLCENACFVESLRKFAEVVPLGRFVLVEGLKVLSLDGRGCPKGR
jgi:activator of 2-hydroxyglutaryl-CoA dehydratase